LRSVVFFIRVEVIFDPKSVGDGARVAIEAVFGSGNASAELDFARFVRL
jgi:hypothetical protein